MIFVLGTPRSGTSWLAKIFDSHPWTLYRHEPDLVRVNTEIPLFVTPEQVPRYRGQAAAYLRELAAIHNVRTSGSLPIFRKAYRRWPAHWLFTSAIYSLRALSLLIGDHPFLRRIPVPEFVSPAGDRKVELVLKSVVSLKRTRLFLAADPSLKVFHVVRHPCGVVASYLRGLRLGKFRGGGSLQALAELPEVARYGYHPAQVEAMSLEERQAWLWMIENHQVVDGAGRHPNYRMVIYEELCGDPAGISRELFAAAGLDWAEQTARFLQRVESYRGQRERYYQVVRSPRKAAFKWRRELSPEVIDRILGVVRDSPLARLYAAKGLL